MKILFLIKIVVLICGGVMKTKKNNKIILLGCVFLFFLIISYLFPYTNDDWAWGSQIGLDRLDNFFKNYNGRYLGNLLVLLLTRYRIIKAITIALSLTLITIFSSKIVDKKNYTLLLIGTILVLLLPQPIFSQAFAWTSGFANYVPPILLVIIWIYINKNLFENVQVNISNWFILPIFLLGVCTCLFMEHVTIYAVILGIFIIIYSKIKKLKINISQIAYSIGTFVGSILMFQNEAYHHIVKGDDFYREVPKDGLIMQSIKRYINTIYDNLIMNNTVILILISICLLFLFYKFIYKNNKFKYKKLANLSISFIVFYSIYALISEFFPNWEIFKLVYKVGEAFLTAIYFIALVIFIFILPNDIDKKKLYFFLGSIVLLTLPLLIVSPVTPRCFYPMYVMFSIFVISLINECFKYIKSNIFYKSINYILKCIILISMFYIFCIIFSAFYVTNKMINYIDMQIENASTEIVLPKTVYENYMKHPYPHNDENMARFKLYYNIPKNLEIKFVDYEEWHDIINK